MHTCREALVAHTKTADLDLNTVKSYQGEFKAAQKDKTVLTGMLPAAFVLYVRGMARREYRCEILFLTRTATLKKQENASDALELAEAFSRWLYDHFTFASGVFEYMVLLDDAGAAGIEVDPLFVTDEYAAVRVGFDVRETQTSPLPT